LWDEYFSRPICKRIMADKQPKRDKVDECA